ncbi:hypothetical protein FF1_015693 [Malus domestica]
MCSFNKLLESVNCLCMAFYAAMNPLLVEVRTPACLSLSCFVEIERVSHSSRSTALPVSSHTISYPTSIGFNSL